MRGQAEVEYDAIAEIYAVWTDSAPICELNRPFYAELYRATEGPVVELGVGDGRIAIEAAKAGKTVWGVDHSSAMLDACRQRAEQAGVLDKLQLIQADFRDFELPARAQLIAIPFHTVGHLLSLGDKLDALRHVHGQLLPGGKLVFDHFVFNDQLARAYEGSPRLRADFTDPDTGRDVLLWVTTQLEREQQLMRLVTWTDELDSEGLVLQRRYRRLRFSWVEPEQMRSLLYRAGFEVEAVYGGFDGEKLTSASPEQVWFARKTS